MILIRDVKVLKGLLPKPKKKVTVPQMNEAIKKAVVDKIARSNANQNK